MKLTVAALVVAGAAALLAQPIELPYAEQVNPPARTFPKHVFAWADVRNGYQYQGRVFYSTLGHARELRDTPWLQKMYFEALRWAMEK